MAPDDKLRADARSNRDRILAVARDALAADPQTSLHAIAKAVGVGQGTLYRHFPTREALVLGVYRDGIEALVKLAPSNTRLCGPSGSGASASPIMAARSTALRTCSGPRCQNRIFRKPTGRWSMPFDS